MPCVWRWAKRNNSMPALKVIARSAIFMDTLVAIKAVSSSPEETINAGIDRAFAAFRFVEETCSRFDESSELRRLSLRTGVPQPVSMLLFEALRFAVKLAETTSGTFDPTVGRMMERKGFGRHYLSGRSPVPLPHSAPAQPETYLDISFDERHRTITLLRPLLLDLGAVAKGMAVDLAKREMEHHEGCLIDAGGDIFAGGTNERCEPWRIGIRHPLQPDAYIHTVRISGGAVCTSGSYERRSPKEAETHHLLDPQSGASSGELLSCTAIAPLAMLADGFSTAAFLLGSRCGLELLESAGLEGLTVSSALDVSMTRGMKRYSDE